MSINIKCLRRPAARRLLLGSLALGFGGTWYVLNASGNPVTSHGS